MAVWKCCPDTHGGFPIDPTGAIDSSDGIQSWLDSLVDGDRASFKPGAIYQVNQPLTITDKNGLTFDGLGATIRALTCYDPNIVGVRPGVHALDSDPGAHTQRRQFIFTRGSNLKFRNLRIIGSGRPWKGCAYGQGYGTHAESALGQGGWTQAADKTVVAIVAWDNEGVNTTVTNPTVWDNTDALHGGVLRASTGWTVWQSSDPASGTGIQFRAFRWDGGTEDIPENPASPNPPNVKQGTEIGAGLVDNGQHFYKMVGVTYTGGETACLPVRNVTVSGGPKNVLVGQYATGENPINTFSGPEAWVPYRRIYRTKVGGTSTGPFYKVADLPNHWPTVAVSTATCAVGTTTATITTATPNDFNTADQVTAGWQVTIAGCSVAAYNGSWTVTQVISTTQFRCTIATLSAAAGTGGTVKRRDQQWIDRVPDVALDTSLVYRGINDASAFSIAVDFPVPVHWSVQMLALANTPEGTPSLVRHDTNGTTAAWGNVTRTTPEGMTVAVVAGLGQATFGTNFDGSLTNFFTQMGEHETNTDISLGTFCRMDQTTAESVAGQVSVSPSMPRVTLVFQVPYPLPRATDLHHEFHHGFSIRGVLGTTIEDCDFVWTYGPGIQAELSGGGGVAASNQIWRRCRFIQCSFGGTSNTGTDGGEISNCFYDRNANQIHDGEPVGGVPYRDWQMIDNTFQGNVNELLAVAGSLNSNVNNLVVARNQQLDTSRGKGMKFSFGTGGGTPVTRTNILIEDNEMWCTSGNSNGMVDLGGITTGYQHVMIRNNIFHGTGGSGAMYAVKLQNCDDVTITGNQFFGSNPTSLIKDMGGNTNIHDLGDNVWGT